MGEFLLRLAFGVAVGLIGGIAASRLIETVSSAAAADLINAVEIIGR